MEKGQIKVNGQEWQVSAAEPQTDDEMNFSYFQESSGLESHRIRFYNNNNSSQEKKIYEVPPAHFFFMGDNRDQSSDGRVWGFVPERYLIGNAWVIWLSCENTLASASYICDFSTLRPHRMFQKVQ